MADDKTVEQLSSEDLFKSAMTDPVEPQAEIPPKAPKSEATAETPPAPAPAPPPAPPAAPETPEAAIPSWRLREEAEARRVAEDRARALEARLNEIATHLQQQQRLPSFADNPDQATQALIARTLQPYAEEQRKTVMYLGKMVASAVHGQDKVDAAEQAFLQAREREQLDPADYERVVGSPNRYDAVVQWHQRQSALSTVGTDPEAWFQKRLEAELANPEFQAKLLEKTRADAAKKPSTVRLPPSLSRATAAAGNSGEPLGDMSDQSLFAYAMRDKR